jgi:hypothetical protein
MAGRKRKIEAGRLSHSAITTRTIKDELRELGAYGDRYYQVDGQEHRRESLINNSLIDARHIFEARADTDRYNPMANARDLPFVENNAYRLMRLCKQWVSEEEQRFKAWQDRYRYHLSTEIRADRRRVRIARNLSPEDLPSDPDEPIPSAEEEDEDEVEDAHDAIANGVQDEAQAILNSAAANAGVIAEITNALTAGDGPPVAANHQQPERTVEEMLEQEDEEALFDKAKTDYPAGSQIRLHWSNQEGVAVEDQEIFNAQIRSYKSKVLRDGTEKFWLNIKYIDHRGWNETIGRRNGQPFSDFWKRLVRDEENNETNE